MNIATADLVLVIFSAVNVVQAAAALVRKPERRLLAALQGLRRPFMVFNFMRNCSLSA